eukprot:CAMPEP_0201535830 /NCGR_PEP_ID=MMETSP0161_2-20130828/60145_1 /ASSEMBLY_ACC=CAM_ASM_000251 /TAXON_ID=180227 /ORGANISM="Neoparamoeba aestuarina, Strain SoJaBio B1-5/56/2" /LENGTH=61 /DNA_ID=CAMNT_0047941201 /DNA_START=76 /DNA_END=262 /DNA_ORIENTATION=+
MRRDRDNGGAGEALVKDDPDDEDELEDILVIEEEEDKEDDLVPLNPEVTKPAEGFIIADAD